MSIIGILLHPHLGVYSRAGPLRPYLVTHPLNNLNCEKLHACSLRLNEYDPLRSLDNPSERKTCTAQRVSGPGKAWPPVVLQKGVASGCAAGASFFAMDFFRGGICNQTHNKESKAIKDPNLEFLEEDEEIEEELGRNHKLMEANLVERGWGKGEFGSKVD
nr:hypothetical protein Iba_chr04cCG12950 [Ipomoea batatas]